MVGRWLQRLLILVVVVAIFTAVGIFIASQEATGQENRYELQVTVAVQTAIARALFNATRTAEAALPQYRIIVLGPDDTLSAIAERYHTTVEVLRMANSLALDVVSGAGIEIIVPEGVQTLEPPRRLREYVAVPGDTLNTLAEDNNIPVEVLELDNPVLAQRQLNPGDIVFLSTLL